MTGLRKYAVALCALVLAPFAGHGQESIVSGLSQSRVSITADFDGSEILIYGAVRREAPSPDSTLDVIITVEGPKAPLVIRRKERVAGIWVNRDQVRIDAAPSFYAVATTGPLSEVLNETDDLRHGISVRRVIRAIGISDEAQNAPDFVEALIRVRTSEDRYREMSGKIELTEDTLFRADVALPSNLTEGDYKVRLFLAREGKVVAVQERMIGVQKEGLERMVFNLAHQQPFAYGILSLVLAVLAGWGASAGFRLLRW